MGTSQHDNDQHLAAVLCLSAFPCACISDLSEGEMLPRERFEFSRMALPPRLGHASLSKILPSSPCSSRGLYQQLVFNFPADAVIVSLMPCRGTGPLQTESAEVAVQLLRCFSGSGMQKAYVEFTEIINGSIRNQAT